MVSNRFIYVWTVTYNQAGPLSKTDQIITESNGSEATLNLPEPPILTALLFTLTLGQQLGILLYSAYWPLLCGLALSMINRCVVRVLLHYPYKMLVYPVDRTEGWPGESRCAAATGARAGLGQAHGLGQEGLCSPNMNLCIQIYPPWS